MGKPPENEVVMTNLGPASFQNGCWFKWNLNVGRGQIVAHRPQVEFNSWVPLVVEPWMKTTWRPNQASSISQLVNAGIGLNGKPLVTKQLPSQHSLFGHMIRWIRNKVTNK